MSSTRTCPLIPSPAAWLWLLAGLVCIGGLGLRHGFPDPVVSDQVLRLTLAVGVGLFALSRLVMLVPLAGLSDRLKSWWPDYVVLIAGTCWWLADRSREPMLLQIGAGYCVAWGTFWAVVRACRGLTRPIVDRPLGLELLAGGAAVILVGGSLLAMPVCWRGTYPVAWEETYPGQTSYELRVHLLSTLFTAAAAVTGTGLTAVDIGHQFSRTGQAIILGLMQIGGLAAMSVGACVSWRLRRLLGWGAADDDHSPAGLGRLILFGAVFCLIAEAVGTGVLYATWPTGPEFADEDRAGRLFDCAFHAVSAFCNVGLTLTEGQMIARREHVGVFVSLLPLMLLGGLGAPVLREVLRRVVRHRGMGMECLSLHSRLSLLTAGLLLVLGTVGLKFIEATPDWQRRTPRDDTPGRLQVAHRPDTLPINRSGLDRAPSQRLSGQTGFSQWKVALYMAVAGRGGGLCTVRTDKDSLAPASHMLLNLLAAIGGELGGTTGGLSVLALCVLAGTLFAAPRPAEHLLASPDAYRAAEGLEVRRHFHTHAALAIIVAVLTGMIILWTATFLFLVYRESGSVSACLTEAVCASFGAGVSAGLTPHLSAQGQIVLIVVMLLGRVLPWMLLLRCLRFPAEPAGACPPSVTGPRPYLFADEPEEPVSPGPPTGQEARTSPPDYTSPPRSDEPSAPYTLSSRPS